MFIFHERIVDLSHNKINFTSPSVFLRMPALRQLILIENQLTAFYYNVNDTKDHSDSEVAEAKENGEAHEHEPEHIMTNLAELRLSSNK